MTTLSKEQIEANTKAVTRLNSNGCYLFKIKDTDQLWYASASVEPKLLTVISVGVLKREHAGYLNVGLKMDVGDKLMITSKVDRGEAHTACLQRKIYTVNNKNITVSDNHEPNVTFKAVSIQKTCLARMVNQGFTYWLIGAKNLLMPVLNTSCLEVIHIPYDVSGKFTVTKSPVYKFEGLGKATPLTLTDLVVDDLGNYNVVDDGVYICFSPERTLMSIKTIGLTASDLASKLMDSILEEWKPHVGRVGYAVTTHENDPTGLRMLPLVLR